MPYEVRKSGSEYCVFKEGTSDKLGCHPTEAKAKAQMRALYANENADEQARDVKTAERKKLAAKGQALPGGGFPIKTVADLKNAIQAFGRAKDKARAKALIIRRAKALGATNLLPAGWIGKKKSDSAGAAGPELIDCPECERAFLHEDRLADHAESVHTFSDIERLVSERVREAYGQKPDATTSVYTWVVDMSTDWVVFTVEKSNDANLYKASYVLVDNQVTLGTPVEVLRRTVYEPVPVPDNNQLTAAD